MPHPHGETSRCFFCGAIRQLKRIVPAAILVLIAAPAYASAWLPAAGSGEIVPMFRYSYANSAFPAAQFSTSSVPSSKEHEEQFRVTGERGLGQGISLDFDLRYGFLYRSKVKKGARVVDTNDGLQDQRIGLSYALRQGTDFADAVGMSVIIPGSSAAKIPSLDSGQWALEPIWRVGFRPGVWHLNADLDLAPRVFADGGVVQFRAHVEVGVPVARRLKLVGKLFFVRSARLSGFNAVRDQGELYNLLRGGVELRYRATERVEPFLAYESGIAGMGGHISQRVTMGVKLSF